MSEKSPISDEWISAYIDGELSEAEQLEFEEKISHQPNAKQLLDELQEMRLLLQALPKHSAPTHLLDGIKQFIHTSDISNAFSSKERVQLKPTHSDKPTHYFISSKYLWVGLSLAAMLFLVIFISPSFWAPLERNLPQNHIAKKPMPQNHRNMSPEIAPSQDQSLSDSVQPTPLVPRSPIHVTEENDRDDLVTKENKKNRPTSLDSTERKKGIALEKQPHHGMLRAAAPNDYQIPLFSPHAPSKESIQIIELSANTPTNQSYLAIKKELQKHFQSWNEPKLTPDQWIATSRSNLTSLGQTKLATDDKARTHRSTKKALQETLAAQKNKKVASTYQVIYIKGHHLKMKSLLEKSLANHKMFAPSKNFFIANQASREQEKISAKLGLKTPKTDAFKLPLPKTRLGKTQALHRSPPTPHATLAEKREDSPKMLTLRKEQKERASSKISVFQEKKDFIPDNQAGNMAFTTSQANVVAWKFATPKETLTFIKNLKNLPANGAAPYEYAKRKKPQKSHVHFIIIISNPQAP